MQALEQPQRHIALGMRWTARVLSVISVATLCMFLFGENGNGPTPKELLLLAFFPAGVMIGLVIAWWRELLGGIIALTSVGIFLVLLASLSDGGLRGTGYFLLFASPALLFIASGLMHVRRSTIDHDRT